eukprot:11442878-Alexandrium_andersonii.AAC.1
MSARKAQQGMHDGMQPQPRQPACRPRTLANTRQLARSPGKAMQRTRWGEQGASHSTHMRTRTPT